MILEKVQITREFPHPITKIYQAFTDQDVVKQWLAPDHFTCSSVVYELHVGGRMHTHFVDPSGNDATSEGIFTKIVPNSMIEYKFEISFLEMHFENLRTLVTFEPTETGTLVTLEHHVPGNGFAEGCTQGSNEALDTLEKLLGGELG
jgi:uncharacterized protein YndB with AHSA1/START domain